MGEWRARLLVIPMTFVGALVLTVMPLPEELAPWRPEWLAMTVLYWTLALPRQVGVGTAWFLGLLLDVTQGALLGQHALGLAVIAWISLRLHQRVRFFPVWQQAVTVGALLAVHLMLVLWVYGITGMAPGTWLYWAPLASSVLLWPLVFVTLRGIRRRWCLGAS
ncbi:rod shape-determining protein MreD [Ectothiorhodospira haloalkaliphila]|uniref:Rod shape-determining protein MreD n=1 Tax=Ectothiorhodospira haloalkaliphila TaxID=421628 RepID=W8KEH7_9GAMM|nr:rod shape-determining protein MreD [Ectothiorhodospira haloalkaliphila]AHK78139.1 rod shape-determining protein MreD [Ectothiorhodospira haloalkaliphila]